MTKEEDKKVDQVIETLDRTMTKEEARRILSSNGYCVAHGVKLEEREVRGSGKYVGEGIPQTYCPICQQEARERERERKLKIQEKIEQAKRVLGL